MEGGLPRDAQGKIIFGKLGDFDCESATVVFDPEDEDEGELMDSECQTDELQYKSRGTQCKTYAEGSSQTMSADEMKFDDAAPPKISPVIIADLEQTMRRNVSTSSAVKALNGFAPEWDSASAKNELLHSLAFNQGSADKGDGENAEIPVSGVAWNCRSNLLAVAYGRMDIQGTDTEGSHVVVWNLQRNYVKATTPDEVLDTPSSVTSVCFHPAHPAIIAAGTFSGELLAWNIGQSEGSRSISVINGSAMHRDAIMQIQWSYEPLQNDHKAVTCSADGRMVIWKLKSGDLDALWPLATWNMIPNVSAAETGIMYAHKSQKLKPIGLTCLTLEKAPASGSGKASKDTGVLYAGSEPGGVFKCFINYSKIFNKVKGVATEEALRNASAAPKNPPELECPITYSYQPHSGPVHSVACARLQRNLFASCGADGTIRVQNALQSSPVLSLEPSGAYIYAVDWSPVKPLLLAAGSGGGVVYLYNLAESVYNPVDKLEIPHRQNVGGLAFSPSGDMLACGDWAGRVQVWKLKTEYREASQQDVEASLSFGFGADDLS